MGLAGHAPSTAQVPSVEQPSPPHERPEAPLVDSAPLSPARILGPASRGESGPRQTLGLRGLRRSLVRLWRVLVPREIDDAKSGRRFSEKASQINLPRYFWLLACRSSVIANGAFHGTPSCCMRAAVWLRPTSGGRTFNATGPFGKTMQSTTGTRTLLALTLRFCVPWTA